MHNDNTKIMDKTREQKLFDEHKKTMSKQISRLNSHAIPFAGVSYEKDRSPKNTGPEITDQIAGVENDGPEK